MTLPDGALVLDVGVNPWLTRQFFTCLTNYAQVAALPSGPAPRACAANRCVCCSWRGVALQSVPCRLLCADAHHDQRQPTGGRARAQGLLPQLQTHPHGTLQGTFL